MNIHKKDKFKKCFSIVLGVLVALLFSIPYLIYRKQVQNLSVIGYIGLIIACTISNVSVFVPSSSTFLVIVAASALNPFLCAFCGGIGACLGEQSSYLCGRISMDGFKNICNRNKKIIVWLKKWEFTTIFVFAFVPLPIFDFVGIVAGTMPINWIKYIVAVFLGKTLKFLCGVIIVYYIFPYIEISLPGLDKNILRDMLDQFGLHPAICFTISDIHLVCQRI